MSDREHHCPFLNRSDQRCSRFFSMHDMQHAFEHCFGAYKSCGVYRDLLAERQARRVAGSTAAGGVRFLWATACTSSTAPAEAASDVSQKAAEPSSAAQPAATGPAPGRTRFVPLRLPGNIAAAAAASVATLALAAH